MRTPQITITFDYTWHPIYPSYGSDLPARVQTTTTRYPTHPFELEPDSIEIEVGYCQCIIQSKYSLFIFQFHATLQNTVTVIINVCY